MFPKQALLAIAVVVAVVMLASLAFCSRESGTRQAEINAAPLAHTTSYDWANLSIQDGRATYVVNGELQSRQGIDVSSFQNEIDWDAVADDGIDFAYIRLGFRWADTGVLGVDDFFEDNMRGAYENGVKRGVYFFSQAVTVEEAHEEAQLVIDTLHGRPLDYPVVFDSEIALDGEGRTADLTNAEMTAIAKAFCEDIEAEGYTAMIYGNNYDMGRYDLSELGTYGRWYAGYVSIPSADFDFAIWQYTNEGSVAGVSGHVDMNIDLTSSWS